MGPKRKRAAADPSPADRDMRDQEVLRANRELAAYFRGRRTEREARAALKIIKAFVRNRERVDVRNRPPLPGASTAKTVQHGSTPKLAAVAGQPGSSGSASPLRPAE